MYSGSAGFNNLIEKSGGNSLITRFKFSNFTIEKFTKLEYYGGSNSSDDIAIGTTNMAYLDVSTITDKIITNQEFLFEVGMKLSDGTVEYAPIGYFKVQKPDENEDTVDFTAYDRMHRFEKPYVSSLAYPTDSEKVLNELCTICGVELATPIASPIAITDKLEGYTCREVLGYIAGIHGFFACFDRYGQLNLRWYSETPVEKRIGLIWSLTKSQSNYTIEKITLAKDTETTYTSGTGISSINHSNPYGTQAIADSIYTSLGGFSYRPCEISMLDDIRLDPWDMLKVTYLDGSVLTIPVMSLEHSFTSGETRVKSFGKTDTENEYNYSGPVTQAMDRMATELLVANRIIATKVDAEWVNAHTVTVTELQATNARVETLEVSKLNASDLSAEVAKLGYATVDNLKAANAKIEDLDVNKLNVADAKVQYAEIDFSNVGIQVVSTSMIKDGAVTNEKVGNLSANKITSGTIDASKITVTNLNADNLTVGTINGKLIGNGSVDLNKLSQEVPTKEYLDNVQKELQGQIDGAIETFTKSEIPTLNNEPASLWTDNETRKKHIGDVCYVLNPASSADGYCYRFANTGTEANPSYEWALIKDSDVTKALQDIIDINGEITGIKQFDTEISSWKTDTDAELSSLKTRTTNLETDIGSKVESSVFNELKQTVDENSSSITSLSTAVSKKADSSTVETLTNTVNSVKQTADTNTSSISSLTSAVENKANQDEVTSISNKITTVEQNLNGLKVDVTNQYQYIDNQLNGNHKIYEIAHAPAKDNYPANEWSIQIYPSDDIYPSDNIIWQYTENEYENYVGTIAYWKDQQRAWRFIRKSDGTHNWVEISETETTYLLNQNASLRIDVNNISTSLSSLTTNVQNNYSTTTQMNNAITQAITAESNSIKLEVSGTYATKKSLESYATTDSLKSYATTASLDLYIKKDPTSGELKSAIEAIADNITLNAKGGLSISGGSSLNITSTGKFELVSNAETYLPPSYNEMNVIKKAVQNETTDMLKKELYDFNSDGVIDVFDMVLAKRYMLGYETEGTFEKWKYAKKSKVTFEINPQNAQKCILLSGTDMWGTLRETYIGIDTVKTVGINALQALLKNLTVVEDESSFSSKSNYAANISSLHVGNFHADYIETSSIKVTNVMEMSSEGTTIKIQNPSDISLTHYGRTKHPAMYTSNPITFDWNGNQLNILVDDTVVATWDWGSGTWLN